MEGRGQAETAALEDLKDYGVDSILQMPVPDRVAFRKMSFDGKPVGGALEVVVDAIIDELAKLAGLAKQHVRGKPVKKTKLAGSK